MSTTIQVQLDAVTALAAELGALAGELDEQTRLCRSAASSVFAALPGEEGLTAGSAGGTWAVLVGALADRTEAVSGVLRTSVEAYRAEDAALAGRIPTPRRGGAGW
jgi:hypothetical protein